MSRVTPARQPTVDPDASGVRVAVSAPRERIEAVLAERAFATFLQPVADLRSGVVVGAEALTRFQLAPARTPDVWFAEAWEVGLGIELELATLRAALALQATMPPGTYLALNVSPRTLTDPGLADVLCGAECHRLVLELTEHDRVDDYEELGFAVARLRATGARLAVDDAGAGFASFQHILRLRPDLIKLDRDLTRAVDADAARHALASALVTFARNIGAQICAEGIETASELAALQRLGVRYGQGYLLGRPAPPPIPTHVQGPWCAAEASFEPPLAIAAPGGTLGDPSRLAALRATALLDSEPEESFDRFARLVTRLLGCQTSLVTLVDDQRQYFKSAVGLAEPWASRRQTPLSHSFCQHTVQTRGPLRIDDARHHPLVRSSLAISELGVVAYAGIPLVTGDGHVLGALCAIEPVPRAWTEGDLETLQQLASAVVTEIELRAVVRRLGEREQTLRLSEQRYRTLVRHLPNASVALFDHDLRFLLADGDQLFESMSLTREQVQGRTLAELAVPENYDRLQRSYRATLAGKKEHVEVQRRGRWYEIHTVPVRDDGGEVTSGMVLTYDITALKRAEAELREEAQFVALLHDVAIVANGERTSAAIFEACLRRVCGHLGWAVGHVYLRQGEQLVSSNAWHLRDEQRFMRFRTATAALHYAWQPEAASQVGQVLATGRPCYRAELHRDPTFLRSAAAGATGLRSGIAVPVSIGGEVVAVIELYAERDSAPTARALQVLHDVGVQLGRVIERERHAAAVQALAVHDELTGLLNRRGFIDLARRHHRLATRSKRPFAIIFLDLDGMKTINDQFGHKAGDSALCDAGTILRGTLREVDLVARLGGDEFVALTVDAGPVEVTGLEERLRESVAAFNRTGAQPFWLSVSVGVTVFEPESPVTLETLLAEADARMYAQKRARKVRGGSLPPPTGDRQECGDARAPTDRQAAR